MKVFEEYLNANHAKLTCYVQTPNRELPQMMRRPGVLVLPGGGYTMCSAREAEPIALAYMHAGFQAFVLEYTTGDRQSRESMAAVFPKAFADAVEAMEYLRTNAEELSLLPDKIAAVGFSAGGNLAVSLATLAEPAQRPNALILGYPAVTAEISTRIGLEQPNLLEKVTSDTPPMFMFNSQGDSVTSATNTLRLSLALAEAHVPYETHTFLTGDHGLSLATAETTDDGSENADVAQWHAMSLRFLRNLWKKDTASRPQLSVYSKIGALLDDEKAAAAINEVLPGVADRLRANPLSRNMTFTAMVKVSGGMISEDMLKTLDEKLKVL